MGKKRRQTEERWEDNIREWTGLEFVTSQRAVENRGKWRKLVMKSPRYGIDHDDDDYCA